MSAVAYNKKQGYDPEVVKRIQRTVGATADGKWGPRTIGQIKAWQKSQGLTVDGKVGPGTLKKFEALWAGDDKAGDDEEIDDPAEAEVPEDEDDHGPPSEPIPEGLAYDYYTRPVDLAEGAEGDEVIALQNDMFAFGFTDDPPDGKFGPNLTKVIVAFQQAAMSPDRIAGFQRVQAPVSFQVVTPGVVDAKTREEIRLWKVKGYCYRKPGDEFIERRVRVAKLGTLPGSSALLREIPSTTKNPRKLHRLAAAALVEMIAACKADTGVELKVQSGWRRHRWRSRKHYEDYVTKKYGSVREGRKWLAYSSPHETGLAVDFGTGGLEPKRKTRAKQRETKAYKWLVEQAYRFGFCPYKAEPWHWEFPLSVRAWTTGLSDWRLSSDPEDLD